MRRRARGFTLIELMIVVAIVGITAAGSIGTAAVLHRKQGAAELQRARGEVLLQYLAQAAVAGRAPDPEVVRRLEDGLRQAQAETRRAPGAQTVEVAYRPAWGPKVRLSVTVVTR